MRAGLILSLLAAALGASAAVGHALNDDPYIWLEDVSSPKAMAWVNGHNAKSTAILEADPRYPEYYKEALEIAEAKDRIPYGGFVHGQIYNFWQDADHVRGILRKTTLQSYASGKPDWTMVLDIDALAKAENANWVYKGMNCALPAERRCLISLSDGGEDAITVREFDLVTAKFVPKGFVLPKGKQSAGWVDENSILVSREWKPGDLGRTGYPFIVKRLRRGQPLSAAVEVFRGKPTDGGYGTGGAVVRDGHNNTLPLIFRSLDTFTSETYLLGPKGTRRIAIPLKSGLADMVDGRVIVSLREDWTPPRSQKRFLAGSIVSLNLAELKADPAHPKPMLVYAPGPRQAFQGTASSKNALMVSILDNVRGRILLYEPAAKGKWTHRAMDLPDNSTVYVASTDSRSDKAFVGFTNFVTPPALWLADAATGNAHQIMAQPAKFDASNIVAEQREATSTDGTKIPYFLVHRRDLKLDGTNPTLLYGYGGFLDTETPYYSATLGKLWLEKGGVYALANIRGGGEFGPAWHEAGLGTKRQLVYDDFAAVGKDLIAGNVTSPRRLGIQGGSNGGLLVGVEFIQHPELWNAVDIQVPLLDMLRISKIAAGASWEGEYGSVEKDPAIRAFWEKTSPYQNLRRDVKYPVPFIWTTSKDDRVGPQHARKFAARMEEYGLPFLFYEVTEGGHASGANLKESAHTTALEMVYLTRRLMDSQEPPAPATVAATK